MAKKKKREREIKISYLLQIYSGGTGPGYTLPFQKAKRKE
jgi:hypothetical protein